jgi:hypothetical protein
MEMAQKKKNQTNKQTNEQRTKNINVILLQQE